MPLQPAYNVDMQELVHQARHLDESDRRALEHLLGRALADDDRVVIRVEEAEPATGGDQVPQLPDWCHVYKGLSDAEIEELEKIVLTRAVIARPVP
jgi:hypothetical protein